MTEFYSNLKDLHSYLKEHGGEKPALVLSLDALRGLLLKNFEQAASYNYAEATGRFGVESVPIDGYSSIAARFTSISVNPETFRLSLWEEEGFVAAKVSPGFTATIALHVKDDTALIFSDIRIVVTNLQFKITASAPNLLIGAPDFEVEGQIVHQSTRKEALQQPNIQEDAVVRVEGAMAYVMSRRIVASAFSTIRSIDLAERFTAFDLRGDWVLEAFDNNLVIRPSGGIAIRENIGCPNRDSAPDLWVGTEIARQQSDNQYSWGVTLNGVPSLEVRRVNNRDVGFAALYAPKPIWDARFANAMPGIAYRESDNGFIGYDVAFTVGLNYLNLAIDPRRHGIVVDFEFTASGGASLTVDVPCFGRCDLAYARFSAAKPSDLRIRLSFVVRQHDGRLLDGKLLLDSQIEKLKIGKVEATVSGFTRWLSLAGGKAAVVGFIIDYVLGRVIERNLPIKIRDVIKQELNSKNFALLDFGELVTFSKHRLFNEVTFSGDADSVLVGLGSFGPD